MWGGGVARSVQGEGPTKGFGHCGVHMKHAGYIWGLRAGEERTKNMPAMVVTPAVFQLEMSALKFFKV